MRMKAEDVQVDDPQKAMQRFRSALAKILKVPKTETRAKHEHRQGAKRPKKTPKGQEAHEPGYITSRTLRLVCQICRCPESSLGWRRA
jgi:hypothetical protein